ncbi:5'-nucleotidase SurE [Bienertia sinuspersici]
MNRNALPPSLVANLQQILSSRNNVEQSSELNNELNQQHQLQIQEEEPSSLPSTADVDADGDVDSNDSKPVILITNGDGIESYGLISLVNALLPDRRFDVHICAPQFDKSASAHSLTVGETVEITSADICGATAFQVSGTPADCVSLALSQALFSWSKPLLNRLYSGAVAGAREALIHDVPSLCISLDWKKDVSCEDDFKDAVDICMPLINASIRDIENGSFPKGCFLNVEFPVSPSKSKGFRLTRQSLWRSSLSWRAISSYKHPSAMNIMANQQSLGIQLARLGRDASAAGAARRLNTNRKNVEIESVGVSGKPETQQTIRKHYRLEFLDKEKEDADDDLDFKAIQNGYVAITPLALSPDLQTEIYLSVSNWLSPVLAGE